MTLAGTALVFAAVAALASYIPARRAMSINPTDALRHRIRNHRNKQARDNKPAWRADGLDRRPSHQRPKPFVGSQIGVVPRRTGSLMSTSRCTL